MSVQTLLISLAVTCVAVGITFLYFRNRMNKTEQKVDLMFQLIQEHEKNSRMANQMQMQQLHQSNTTTQFQNNEPELINISDNENDESEEEFDSDDSAEISDDEEDKLVIQNNDATDVTDITDVTDVSNTVKMISLTLDGAETSVAELTPANLMETLEVNSLSVNHDDESVHSIDELDEVHLSENDDELDGSQHADQESNSSKSDDGTLNNFVVTKKISSSQQDTSSSDEDNTIEVVKEDTMSTDYAKLTKAQLKKLAEEKGLAGYKKLTKTGLVELLNQNQ